MTSTGGAAEQLTARKVIIVAPHFPPSNLAGVHRSRLFAQHLPEFGWDPIIVTVNPARYEEALDPALSELVSSQLRVEQVGALPTRPVRVVGDIGIRGFVPMLRKIMAIVDREKIDFLYIPIPSFYAALLGRIVYFMRAIPYGIDYIDPWVQPATGNEKIKARASLALARVLEPIAVKHASLITGVAESYFAPVLQRNPALAKKIVSASMPYGGEAQDHEYVRRSNARASVFLPQDGRFRLVYAGALLPRAHAPLRRLCSAIASDPAIRNRVELYFIGTGKSPNDSEGYNVRPVAEEFGLWNDVIHEHPARIPYLDTLAHLEAADGILVLGSTEAHYTPSKVYQGVLARKPILAILHRESTACQVVRETHAGIVLDFAGEHDVSRIERTFPDTIREFLEFAGSFDPNLVDKEAFDRYSARSVTAILAGALDRALELDAG